MAMVLNVVRALYIEKQIPLYNYLGDTLWLNDFEVIRYLNRLYEERFHKKSILHDLIADRQQLYKRLYTVRTGSMDEADNTLYTRLSELSFDEEKTVRLNIGGGHTGVCP